MSEARPDGVGRIRGIYTSLFCVLRRRRLSCRVLQETFVQAKLLLFFSDFIFNSKVNCSNGLGREIVYLFFFPNIYLWCFVFFLNSTLSLVVLLSDIFNYSKSIFTIQGL